MTEAYVSPEPSDETPKKLSPRAGTKIIQIAASADGRLFVLNEMGQMAYTDNPSGYPDGVKWQVIERPELDKNLYLGDDPLTAMLPEQNPEE